jgi:DNA-binding IclR family transcriptional regulator
LTIDGVRVGHVEEAIVLYLSTGHQPRSAAELARTLGFQAGSVGRSLSHLVELGWVNKPDQVVWALMPEGRVAAKHFAATLAARLVSLERQFSRARRTYQVYLDAQAFHAAAS